MYSCAAQRIYLCRESDFASQFLHFAYCRSPVLRGMLILVHRYMESVLDQGGRTADLNVHAITWAAGYVEALISRKFNHRIVIVLAGAKSFSELLYAEVLPEIRTGRISELFKEAI